jgi:hypothetical protein
MDNTNKKVINKKDGESSLLNNLINYVSSMSKFSLAIVSIFIFIFLGMLSASSDFLSKIIIIFLGIFTFLIASYLVAVKTIIIKKFAKDIGFEYVGKGDLSSVEGCIFEPGYAKGISDLIIGSDKDHEIKIFTYNFTVGFGKTAHTYSFTIFENTFSGNMPHILLEPRSLFFDPMDFNFSGGHEIALEGDFNKHFYFTVEKEFEIEALQIFTPDFMAELIDSSKKFGFEFYKNKLYIYNSSFITKPNQIEEFFNISNKLCDRVEPVVRRIHSDVDSLKEIMDKYKI